jgi:hypothetical protein
MFGNWIAWEDVNYVNYMMDVKCAAKQYTGGSLVLLYCCTAANCAILLSLKLQKLSEFQMLQFHVDHVQQIQMLSIESYPLLYT